MLLWVRRVRPIQREETVDQQVHVRDQKAHRPVAFQLLRNRCVAPGNTHAGATEAGWIQVGGLDFGDHRK
jgi:hypothetical protein